MPIGNIEACFSSEDETVHKFVNEMLKLKQGGDVKLENSYVLVVGSAFSLVNSASTDSLLLGGRVIVVEDELVHRSDMNEVERYIILFLRLYCFNL